MLASNAIIIPLADHLPLKQGLRRYFFHACHFVYVLADHLPLKQGLRLFLLMR